MTRSRIRSRATPTIGATTAARAPTSTYDRAYDRGAFAGGQPVDTSALGTLVGLVDALGQAQPEAGEHLLAAAHELVLAVKTVVDATEAVLAAQRAAMAERNEADHRTSPSSESERAGEAEPPAASARVADDPAATARRPGVYRIDLG